MNKALATPEMFAALREERPRSRHHHAAGISRHDQVRSADVEEADQGRKNQRRRAAVSDVSYASIVVIPARSWNPGCIESMPGSQPRAGTTLCMKLAGRHTSQELRRPRALPPCARRPLDVRAS